jgi:hypothetical protein
MAADSRLSSKVRAALAEIPGRWRAEYGSRHIKIYVDDRLAAIAPICASDKNKRADLNLVSYIRRAARRNPADAES